jgi:hypothetical protein
MPQHAKRGNGSNGCFRAFVLARTPALCPRKTLSPILRRANVGMRQDHGLFIRLRNI